MKNKTYNIITIGCQTNKSDSERIAGSLEKLNYQWTDDKDRADLVVVNTCGVRQTAEDRVYGIIPRIKKVNPKVKIILAGCLSQRKDVQRRLKQAVDIWLPINRISNFQFLISKQIQNSKFKIQNCDYLKLQPKYSSHFSAFVPIGNGCNNFCAYCVVPYARGREVYRPAGDVLDEVKSLIKKEYKEIILIAQNVNSYKSLFAPKNAKKRQNINFAQLLKMVNDIKGDFWIKFATSHPKDMSDQLIRTVANCSKVCEHIHLPVQAGDNEILKKMNRNYTIEHYKKLIKKIRQAIPEVSITTDVIVGFPGETKEQFNNAAKLFKEIKFDMAYIAQYSPRPGTVAEKLHDNVTKKEKKRREEELMNILRKNALENNKKYVGKVVEVLVENKKNGIYFGKTRTDKNVKIADNRKQKTDLAGKFVKVKITKARDFGLEGELK